MQKCTQTLFSVTTKMRAGLQRNLIHLEITCIRVTVFYHHTGLERRLIMHRDVEGDRLF